MTSIPMIPPGVARSKRLEDLAAESIQTRRWNRPKLDRDLMISVRHRRAARAAQYLRE
jgi:hypothetical protein